MNLQSPVGSGHYVRLRSWIIACRSGWNVLWNGALDNSSAVSAVSAMTCAVGAASAHGARGRASCKRQVPGSNPGTGSQVRKGKYLQCVSVRGTKELAHGDAVGSGRGLAGACRAVDCGRETYEVEFKGEQRERLNDRDLVEAVVCLATDVSTRKPTSGISWTIKPAFGSTQVRKVRGRLAEYAGTLGFISPSHCSRSPHGAGEGVSSARGLFRSW